MKPLNALPLWKSPLPVGLINGRTLKLKWINDFFHLMASHFMYYGQNNISLSYVFCNVLLIILFYWKYRFPLFLLQARAFFHWWQDEIYGTSYAVAYYLKEILKFDKKVFTIGTTGMTQELDELGIPHTGSGVGWMQNVCVGFIHCQ